MEKYRLIDGKRLTAEQKQKLIEASRSTLLRTPSHLERVLSNNSFIGLMQGEEYMAFLWYIRTGIRAEISLIQTVPGKRSRAFVRKFGFSPSQFLLQQLGRRGIKEFDTKLTTKKGQRFIERVKKSGLIEEPFPRTAFDELRTFRLGEKALRKPRRKH